MSADATPITAARFAAALKDLSIASLHGKVAELQNSINHLKDSNKQLEDHLRAQPVDQRADPDLVDAIGENEEVVRTMMSRIGMIKNEVQERGMPWPEEHASDTAPIADSNGQNSSSEAAPANADVDSVRPVAAQAQTQISQPRSGRYSDEELARRIHDRFGEDQEDQNGVHL